MKKVDYEHFSRFRMPGNLTVSGEDVYFCCKRAELEENSYKSDLYVLRGGETLRLTSAGDVNDYFLLPEGVVFPALREKKDKETAEKGIPLTVLQLLPNAGGEAREWLRLDYSAEDFRFLTPERFFFTAAYSHDYAAALENCGGDGEKAAARMKEEADYRVVDEQPYRFNGAGYINKQRTRLYFYDAGKVTPVTDEWTSVTMGALSPEGTKLYLTGAAYEEVGSQYDRLWELDTATLALRDVTVCDTAQNFGALPLPGGKWISMASVGEKYGLNENPRLFLREGDAYRALCTDGEHNFYNSVGSDIKSEASHGWQPRFRDGGCYLADTQSDSTQIVRVDAETGAVTNVTHERGCITDFALLGEGLVISALRGAFGQELYYVDARGEETRLTHFSDGLTAEYEYSAPIDLRVVNERGDEVQGWVIPPVDMEKGREYPTILDIHGGPKTAYGNCYFHEMQLWASMGYAVIFCNPTGSDGRSDDFADIRGDYGGQDFRDIMAFTDEAVRRFDFIDPGRMGVTGGSYGGFMTNWIIGHTDRFRAAASQRSISNWISFYGTSDIGTEFAVDQTGGEPWKNMEKMWAHSPVAYADRARTPTLFIHSDEDYRCPLEQGEQMYAALRSHGVTARMCVFKGENHELSRSGKPKHRVRRLREITQWFERYLKG